VSGAVSYQGMPMSGRKSPAVPAISSDNWEKVFEAALTENDPAVRERRLQSAKDAVMDRIEDSFDTASHSESRLLLAALNTINEFQRLSKANDSRRCRPPNPSAMLHKPNRLTEEYR
jgi:hypothetical protein